MKIKIILRKFRTLTNIIKYAILEKSFRGKLKYLFFDKGSQDLMICFAALPPKEKPLYNFVKGFDKLPLDRLYIGDYWGYRGSYYLYENGSLISLQIDTESDIYYQKQDFERAYNEHPEVQFLMVNATDGVQETMETAKQYIAENGFTFPVVYDTEQSAVYAYYVTGFPCTVTCPSSMSFLILERVNSSVCSARNTSSRL